MVTLRFHQTGSTQTGFTRTCFAVVLVFLLAACDLEQSGAPSAPSDTLSSFLGDWRSERPSPASSCSDLQWQVTEISAATATGTFTATCTDGTTLAGTASGTPAGDRLRWTATGTATNSLGVACPFALDGTAVPNGNTIQVAYDGTSCLGPVSGTEMLQKG